MLFRDLSLEASFIGCLWNSFFSSSQPLRVSWIQSTNHILLSLVAKIPTKIFKNAQIFLLQSKSWISACCHCMKIHANHLIFSHHAVCMKNFPKKTIKQITSCYITEQQEDKKGEKWKNAIFFSFFSHYNGLSLFA